MSQQTDSAWAECAEAAELGRQIGTIATDPAIDAVNAAYEACRELRTIIDTANDGFLLMDTEGRLLDVNRSYCLMSGYSRPELMTMTIRDLAVLVPGGVENRLEQVLREGSVRVETQHRRKDGSIMDLDVSITHPPELDNRIFGFCRDITDRKRVENALRESEQRFRAIFNDSGMGIIVVDMQGRIVEYNHFFLKMLGYTGDELRTMTFPEFTHPAERDLDWELYRELIEGGRDSYQIEKRYCTKSGALKWGHVTASLLRDAAGRPSYGIRMVEDITERKRAELMLAESRAELEALVGSTDDYIWSVDARSFGLLTYNSALSSYFLVHRGLAIAKGMTPSDLLPAVLATEWQGWYEQALAQGSYTVEYASRETPVTLLLSFSLLRRGSEIYGISVFGKNIARLKEAEKELLHYQAQLNALASELSLAQERERRRIAFEIHDHVVQSLTLGKIMVSNSIRTGSPDRLEGVSLILDDAIRQMRSLIFELSPPLLYEMGLVAALEALGERLGQEHGFSFNLLDGCAAPPLEEDILVSVFQSVRELFMNIVKHARARNVTINVESEGSMLRISVEDDGVGFDAENAFSKARQQHSMGLFAIQQRLRHLGGSFEIESAPDRGARMELIVPVTAPAGTRRIDR